VDPLSAAAPALAVTKNNRMELAAIEAPEALQRPAKVTLRNDSKYLLDGITKWIKGWQLKGWKSAARKPVKDDDLWRGLADAISRHDVTVGVGEGVTLAIRQRARRRTGAASERLPPWSVPPR
jgi:ribonuclease HI